MDSVGKFKSETDPYFTKKSTQNVILLLKEEYDVYLAS